MVQLANFSFFASLGVIQSVAKHSRHLVFSKIEEPYEKLPKHLNSGITKLFHCFSRGLKMEETEELHI